MSRIPTLKQMLETEPTDAFLLFALAKEYEGIGDTATAQVYYTTCAEHNPDYVGLYYHLGKHYERLNDLPQAMAFYEKGMDVAKAANDRHAFSELQQAHWEISVED
jgi:tetratricopeptide (TPR) repeat protein